MGMGPALLFFLGSTVVLQLFVIDGVAGGSCPKRILRRIGLTGYLSACRYLCRGILPKIGYEDDGTPCTRLFRSGICRNGDCITDVPPDPSLQTPRGKPGVRDSKGGVQRTGGSGSTAAAPTSTGQGRASKTTSGAQRPGR